MIVGAFFSLISAMSFSMNSILVRRGMTGASASQGAFITVLIGVPLFLVASLVTGDLFRASDLTLNSYLLLAGAGVVHFGIGRYFNYRAIGAIGASRSQPIQTINIPYAIFMAWLLLGETVTWLMAFGILLILVGPAVMLERPRQPRVPVPRGAAQDAELQAPTQAFQLRQVEGYVTAVLAGLCYGSSPILISAALKGHSNVSIFGGLVSYFAAAAVLMASMALPGRRELVRSMNLRTFRLFFSAGFFVFLAQMLRFVALSLAPVTIVSPLQRLTALFTLLLSAVFNRGLERITLKLVAGVALSLAGTVLLVFAGTGG